MEDKGIAEIIAVEKEIHHRIEEERKRADEWVEGIRKKAEEDLARATEEIEKAYKERLLAYEKEIKNEASGIVGEAMRWRERINNLAEDELRGIIQGFIKRIIPP